LRKRSKKVKAGSGWNVGTMWPASLMVMNEKSVEAPGTVYVVA